MQVAISIFKNLLYFHMLAINNQKQKLKSVFKIPFPVAPKTGK